MKCIATSSLPHSRPLLIFPHNSVFLLQTYCVSIKRLVPDWSLKLSIIFSDQYKMSDHLKILTTVKKKKKEENEECSGKIFILW